MVSCLSLFRILLGKRTFLSSPLEPRCEAETILAVARLEARPGNRKSDR